MVRQTSTSLRAQHFSRSYDDSQALGSLVLNLNFSYTTMSNMTEIQRDELANIKSTCKHLLSTFYYWNQASTKWKSYVQIWETILRQRCNEHRKYYKDQLLFQTNRSFAHYINYSQCSMSNKYFVLSVFLSK